MQITKNIDTSKYKYKGYGICFDEGSLFSIGNINNGRNVINFWSTRKFSYSFK